MSNTQKKNVPELRFPGFEGEWEEKTISSFLKESKIKGSNGSHAKKLTVKLWGKGVVPKKETFKGSDNTQYYKRKAGQLMYGKLDFLNCAFGIVPDSLNNYESTIDSPSFDFINGDSKFLLERIKLKSFYKKFGDIANGSRKAKRINQDTFLSLSVFAPKYDEQLRIGKFFSKLDRQIELEEQKLELLQQQKKGYMQKIFSQELRFKDENGEDYPEWEEKKLGEVAEIIGGGTPSTKNKLYWNGEINWFSPIEIGNTIYVYSSQKKITEEGLRKSSAKILPVGTILFTSRAGIGKTAILAKESTTNQGFQSIVPRKGVLDSYYVYTISFILKILAEKVGAGSTFSEVSKKQMEQLHLNIPIIKEQKNIGKFFSKFDNLIEIQEQKLEFLKRRKQSLLQKMFI
ncbi:TPA: restriction endonuclease subunit S [Staphylococcus aureus]